MQIRNKTRRDHLNLKEDTPMKKLIIGIITTITVCAATSQAYSTDRVLAGTLIGAGSGALIGQAIGGDTESTVLGTAIGGIVGFTAGSLHQQNHVSSSIHIGYNSSYSERYHRPYKGHGNYYPSHNSYYPRARHYDRHNYYTPKNKIVIKQVHKTVNHYKVTKNTRNRDTFKGRQDNRNNGQHSPRHNGNNRERRAQRR
jgi:uncharacterized protein YcfJ